MPLTFIDIERRKSWRIGIFFFILLALYFIMTAVIVLSFAPDPRLVHAKFWIFAFLFSLGIAAVHFWFSAYDAVDRVIRSLDAQAPDPKDEVHRMFWNIVQELHVVTGHRRSIRPVVIPSLSLNALAAADLRGEAVIGITEGLLSRLSRSHVESVVAHEAHHILSGDCLEATVASSLFGTYSVVIERMVRTSRGRTFGSPAFLLAWILLKLSYLLNLFISREREYRADAASVRMTRNPVALAETLYQLGRSQRGAGFIGAGLEMLCIVNPHESVLDETEGLVSDLLSTHPPLKKRIDILLRMARVSISNLERSAEERAKPGRAIMRDAELIYYAMNPGHEWEGPFSFADLAALPWLSPLTWIAAGKGESVDRAWKDPALGVLFAARISQKEVKSAYSCPVCNQPLVVMRYEGTEVHQCRFCAGTLVENNKIPRIIARTERPCTERINALARAVLMENQAKMMRKNRGMKVQVVPPLTCPRCKNSMSRGFYSSAHLIEVDRCRGCDLTWFDRDELDMLQCIIENRLIPEIAL